MIINIYHIMGGSISPLVSRGSKEEWKTKIPTWGPPTPNREWERGASFYPKGERGKRDESSPKGK